MPWSREKILRALRRQRQQYPEPARPVARSIDIGDPDLKSPKIRSSTEKWLRTDAEIAQEQERAARIRRSRKVEDLQACLSTQLQISLDHGIPFEDLNQSVLDSKIDALCVENPTLRKAVDRLDDDAEEHLKWYEDPNSFQGKMLNTFLVRPSLRSSKDKVEATVEHSLGLLDVLTDQPYPEAALEAHEIYSIILFALNIAAAVWDLYDSFTFLGFKFGALVLGTIDFFFMLFTLAPLMKRYKCFKDDKQSTKHLIYVQNVVGELLLYPLLVITLVGVATAQAYLFNGALNSFTFVVVLLGLADLIWTYTERLIIIKSAAGDIERKIHTKFATKAGRVMQRAYLAVVGNSLLFGVMLAMLFRQVERDNLTSNDFTITIYSGYYIASALLFPLMSFVSFVLSNMHWMYESLIQLALLAKRHAGLLNEIEEKSSENVKMSLNIFMAKLEASRTLMQEYVDAKLYQKLMSPYTSWFVYCILLMWLSILAGQILMAAFMQPPGEEMAISDIVILVTFAVLTVLINIQAICLLLFLPIFALMYLLCLILWLVSKCCCKKKASDMWKKVRSALRTTAKKDEEEEKNQREGLKKFKMLAEKVSRSAETQKDKDHLEQHRSQSVPIPGVPHPEITKTPRILSASPKKVLRHPVKPRTLTPSLVHIVEIEDDKETEQRSPLEVVESVKMSSDYKPRYMRPAAKSELQRNEDSEPAVASSVSNKLYSSNPWNAQRGAIAMSDQEKGLQSRLSQNVRVQPSRGLSSDSADVQVIDI